MLRPDTEEHGQPRRAGGGGTGRAPLGASGGPAPCDPSFRTSGLQDRERLCFCCLKPPCLWYVVTGATGNECGWSQPPPLPVPAPQEVTLSSS